LTLRVRRTVQTNDLQLCAQRRGRVCDVPHIIMFAACALALWRLPLLLWDVVRRAKTAVEWRRCVREHLSLVLCDFPVAVVQVKVATQTRAVATHLTRATRAATRMVTRWRHQTVPSPLPSCACRTLSCRPYPLSLHRSCRCRSWLCRRHSFIHNNRLPHCRFHH
jgi:hypothetical protein